MGKDLHVVAYRKLIDVVRTVLASVIASPAVSLRYYFTFGTGM